MGDVLMLSNKIRLLREKMNLTQSELSALINVPRVSISNWERGKEIPNIRHLNFLANYFHVTLDYIMDLNDKNFFESISSYEIDKVFVGKRLALFRKEHHLTLRELGYILNTTSSTISAYESGKTLLLTAFAYQISLKYRVSMDWLYGKVK